MQRRSRELLNDIQRYCNIVAELTEGRSQPIAEYDVKTRLAVERCFEVVGEALFRLERHDSETAEKISSVRKIIGFRNQIAHGYDTIDFNAVDRILQEHLMILRREVADLIAEAS
jgi:uncharacterized protein with HEPN domain